MLSREGRSEMIENDLPFGAFLQLHNELSNKGPKGNAKMHAKDFDTYGDPNLRSSKGAGKKLPGGGKRSRRGTGALQINRLLTNEGTPSLDTEIEAINDRLGTDFTPQDAIDYIMDRANNPGKYTAENVNLAERIEAEGPDAVLGPIQIDVEETTTEAAPTTESAPTVTEETTVAAPTTEAAPAPAPKKKAPAPKERKPFIPREIELKIKENQEEIQSLESDISFSENKIEDLEMEIELEKREYKRGKELCC